MKTIVSFFSISLAVCLLTLLSCSKSDDGPSYPTPPKNFVKSIPTKITQTDTGSKYELSFDYDKSARITKITDRTYSLTGGETKVNFEYTITYNDASPFYSADKAPIVASLKLIDYKQDISGTAVETLRTYTYTSDTNGKLKIQTNTSSNGSSTYLVDAVTGRILTKSELNQSGASSSTLTYEYDERGNPVKSTHSSGYASSFTFDHMNGVFLSTPTPQWLISVLYIPLNSFGSVNNYEVDGYTLEYNANGYLSKQTKTTTKKSNSLRTGYIDKNFTFEYIPVSQVQ